MKITSELMGLSIMTAQASTGYEIEMGIYSTQPMKIIGFWATNKKNQKEKKVLLMENIETFTENSVVVKHLKSLNTLDQLPEIKSIAENQFNIEKIDIVDEKGQILGVVKDTIFDEENGHIKGLIISQGIILDLAKGYAIIPLIQGIELNKNQIQINDVDFYELLLDQQGGLQKLFGIDKRN